MQQTLPDIENKGGALIALSPMTRENSLAFRQKLGLEYTLVTDSDNTAAKAFGLVFKLPGTIQTIYSSFGIDLPRVNGESSYSLPIPATYVVDTKGKIRLSFIDVDYTARLEPADIVAALHSII